MVRVLPIILGQLTEQQELASVPVELEQIGAELIDGSAHPVLTEEHGKALDLLGTQPVPEL